MSTRAVNSAFPCANSLSVLAPAMDINTSRWTSCFNDRKYSVLVSILKRFSSMISAFIRSLYSLTRTGTPSHVHSVTFPLNTSSTCPRGLTHCSLYSRLMVISVPSTTNVPSTEHSQCCRGLPFSSVVRKLKSLRSLLSLPKSSQQNASMCLDLPRPLRPQIRVTVPSVWNCVVLSFSPRQLRSVIDFSWIAFIYFDF